jgi:adenylate cyclase
MVKKLIKFIGLGIAILLITALVIRQGWFMGLQRGLQNKFYDYDSASPKIVIVSIDEKSLGGENLGPFSQWKREYYAQAINALNGAGAAAIGIDVTLPDASAHGKSDDEALRDTLKKYDNVVIAGRYYFDNGIRQTDLPNAAILEADPKIGWINVQLDDDGFVRTIPIFAATKDKILEAFSLQLARIYLKAEPVDYRVINDSFHFSEKTVIPTMTKRDSNTNQDVYLMYVNYFAEPDKFTRISFADLLSGKLVDTYGNPIDFKDKIALIGPTAIDLKDDYPTPVSQGVKMPGVEIHANNIQTIINGQFLRDQPVLSLWLTLLTLLIVNITLFSFLKIRYTIPITALEIFGVLVAGIVLYEFRIFMNVVYPILLILLSFVGTYLLRFILEQKERKFVEGAFGHYVNKDVVRQIIKNPKALELGGAEKNITVFFSDIAGFTTISEKMGPVELVKFLNEYLQDMTEVILKYQGTLDKYEGDAIMAFWNAPIAINDHALNACLAALENQEHLAKLRKKWTAEGKPAIHARIGINTGNAVVGNMGSENRFNYTAMGDNVNLGSRLEGINKEYGTEIIISESVYNQVKEKLVCRELDLIRVKGKTVPVRILELVGEVKKVNRDLLDRNARFYDALRDYRSKNFTSAKQKFEALKDDAPSRVFAKRCEDFIKNPPPAEWDGVWTYMTK